MYNNEQAITKYVMDALEEGISIQEIKEEVYRLAHGESVIDPMIDQLRERLLSDGGRYETL